MIDIFEAARDGNTEAIIEFIKKGVDINALDRYGTPAIYYAAWHGRLSVLVILLTNGADINKPIDLSLGGENGRGDWTALHVAVEQGNAEVVTLLLDYGADINVTNHTGRTPLFKAMDQIDEHIGPDIAEILIRRGADVNLIPQNGHTLLYKARLYGRADLEVLLIKAGARDS